jgi:hypothetical protein
MNTIRGYGLPKKIAPENIFPGDGTDITVSPTLIVGEYTAPE